jgi:2-polyprenyl-6-methoxyphenol hydroxylase-like FAD-dependent oxidoreductase
LQPGTVIWDSQFLSMTPDGEGWQLVFKKRGAASPLGDTAEKSVTDYADIVIAADGANSKIRPLITPIKPFYAGITVVEGSVYNAAIASPRISKLLKGGKIFAFGNDQSLIVSSKGDSSYVFYTGCKTPEHWVTDSGIDFDNKEQVLAWFRAAFAGWDAVWEEMFVQAEPHFIPRPQYCMPLDQHWEALPNLTMLGDAAHLMPPYAGEGVNMAMQDALELSVCLTNEAFTTTQEAIAHYEMQMRARASATAQITLDSTEMLHSGDPITSMINMFSGFEDSGK